MAKTKRWIGAAALLLGALCSAGAQPVPSSLPESVAQALQRSGVAEDDVAFLVVPVEGGAPLVSHNVTQAMTPASVMKLVTTAAALETLGPNFRWQTTVWQEGKLNGDTLQGNLYLKGSGDPALVQEQLWLLLQNVQRQGVRHITGDIVLDRSIYTDIPEDPSVFDNEGMSPYNVQPDALLVNHNAVAVHLLPQGAQVRVVLEPAVSAPQVPTSWPMVSSRSAEDCKQWMLALDQGSRDAHAIALPSEPYPSSCGQQTWRAAWPQPEQYAGLVVRALWEQMGGTIQGQVRIGKVSQALQQQPPLWVHQSPPLAEVVRDIDKFSNNVMARQLLLTLGLERMGTANLGSARQALQQWWQQRLPHSPVPVVDNGSGLSRTALVSAQGLGDLLLYMWRAPTMSEWMSSLPVAGVDGTLRHATLQARGRAHLKTGTLRGANSLAGYVLDKKGRRYALVALARGDNAGLARSAMYRLVDWVAQRH